VGDLLMSLIHTRLATAYFNVLATVPPVASNEQVKLMLQNLAERFKLALHREKREPVYNLVVAKGGPKMKPSQSDLGAGGGSFGPWNCHARYVYSIAAGSIRIEVALVSVERQVHCVRQGASFLPGFCLPYRLLHV
jgi:uncharacterized protein (TIGR03435 family)